VFEKRVLRKVFGQTVVEVTGSWGKFHKISFITCTICHIISMIKSRRMRGAGNVSHMGDNSIDGFGGNI
jgi:hypothetical protein